MVKARRNHRNDWMDWLEAAVMGLAIMVGAALFVFGGGAIIMKAMAGSAKFAVGQCITAPDQEEWDHLPIYVVEKVGKAHYLVKDCALDIESSMYFGDSDVAVPCPKGCVPNCNDPKICPVR